MFKHAPGQFGNNKRLGHPFSHLSQLRPSEDNRGWSFWSVVDTVTTTFYYRGSNTAMCAWKAMFRMVDAAHNGVDGIALPQGKTGAPLNQGDLQATRNGNERSGKSSGSFRSRTEELGLNFFGKLIFKYFGTRISHPDLLIKFRDRICNGNYLQKRRKTVWDGRCTFIEVIFSECTI